MVTFCLTYGDGLSDIDIEQLIAFHQEQKTLVTVTAIQPAGRFGSIEISGTKAQSFFEKPKGDNRWVNGGFFVCEPEILNYIQGDDTSWETEPLENLAAAQELSVFKHDGFWRSMDTLRDKVHLEKLWNDGGALGNHGESQLWQNRKVAVTGHTGFKGSWLTFWLNKLSISKPWLRPNTANKSIVVR